MRYWIWWNDLIQGPFETEELFNLKAFSEDLLVCMEDREDWVPAGRVADLSPMLVKFRENYSPPRVPPPPPPKRAPTVIPLQGEFFSEAPGQQPLLDTEEGPKGPYAYHSIFEETQIVPSYLVGRVTMPFHFTRQPDLRTGIIELPRPVPTTVYREMPPMSRESPVKEFIPPVEESPQQEVSLEFLKDQGLLDIPEIPETPLPEAFRPFEQETVPAETAASTEPEPFVLPSSGYEDSSPSKKLSWLPWVLGVALAFGAIGSLGYWLMDRASSRAAIKEVHDIDVKALPAPGGEAPKPISEVPEKVVKFTGAKSKKAAAVIHKPSPKQVKQKPTVPQKTNPSPTPVAQAPAVQKAVTPAPAPSTADDILDEVMRKDEEALVLPSLPAAIQEVPATQSTPNPWKDKQTEAIGFVQNKNIPKTKISIGTQAKTLLQQMHEKELIHAAETGERLYLPDKITWTALQEDGPTYRVYLNFLAWQVSGERVQSRSYQFIVNLKTKEIRPENTETTQEFFTQTVNTAFKHNPMATDIESILGGVDTYNKHKMRLMIIKPSRKNREDRKQIEVSMAAANTKVKKAAAYFRKTYENKSLDNLAKAYQFTDLMKE